MANDQSSDKMGGDWRKRQKWGLKTISNGVDLVRILCMREVLHAFSVLGIGFMGLVIDGYLQKIRVLAGNKWRWPHAAQVSA